MNRPETPRPLRRRGTPGTEGAHIHIGRHHTVVEREPATYLRLDAEGRWITFGAGPRIYRRSVDGRILQHDGSIFSALAEPQAAQVLDEADACVQALWAWSKQAATAQDIPDRAALESRLAAATRWTPDRLLLEGERLKEAYPEPVVILPPHRYRDLVIQPAIGCPNHSCSFCAFYPARGFRVLDPKAFDAHLQAVRDAMGAAHVERSGIFLGSASALSLGDTLLLDRLERIRAVFGERRRGMAAFLDPDRAPARTPADWARLAEAGVVESTIGLETGEASLRVSTGKSGDMERLGQSITGQKEGGLAVALTVLIGLGGPEHAVAHREETLRFIGRLPLERRDRIYLSPLAGGLPAEQMASETAAFRAALGEATPARVGDYLIERFAWLL